MWLVDFIVTRPLTVLLSILLTVIWFVLNQFVVPVENVSFHMESIIQNKEYWRCMSSQFAHYSIIHLGFNLVSLNGFWWMEGIYGEVEYLKFSFFLLIGSFLFQILIFSFLIRTGYVGYANIHGVGYSCVIFGLMMIACIQTPYEMFNILGLKLPMFIMPFFSLVITKLIVPRSSFVGHLCGIIAAFPIAFNFFFWCNDFLFFSIVFWSSILFLWTLKKTKPNLPIIRLLSTQQQVDSMNIENNVLNRDIDIRNFEFEYLDGSPV